MRCALVLASLFTVLLIPRPVAATSFTFNTSDSEFTPGVKNQGWWANPTISSFDANDNYAVGFGTGNPMDPTINEFRDFFSFDLSQLSGQTILSATLQVNGGSYSSNSPSETLAFFDVSTPANVLNNNTGLNAAIFNDLGTGVSYGSFVVPPYPFNAFLSYALNAAALADIQAVEGGFFSIGGALQGDVGEGVLFGGTDGGGIQRLVVTTVPDNGSTLMLLGVAMLGLLVVTRTQSMVSRVIV